MGWIKRMLPEPDDAEYQKMMEEAWQNSQADIWYEQQDKDQRFIKEQGNGTSQD